MLIRKGTAAGSDRALTAIEQVKTLGKLTLVEQAQRLADPPFPVHTWSAGHRHTRVPRCLAEGPQGVDGAPRRPSWNCAGAVPGVPEPLFWV